MKETFAALGRSSVPAPLQSSSDETRIGRKIEIHPNPYLDGKTSKPIFAHVALMIYFESTFGALSTPPFSQLLCEPLGVWIGETWVDRARLWKGSPTQKGLGTSPACAGRRPLRCHSPIRAVGHLGLHLCKCMPTNTLILHLTAGRVAIRTHGIEVVSGTARIFR